MNRWMHVLDLPLIQHARRCQAWVLYFIVVKTKSLVLRTVMLCAISQIAILAVADISQNIRLAQSDHILQMNIQHSSLIFLCFKFQTIYTIVDSSLADGIVPCRRKFIYILDLPGAVARNITVGTQAGIICMALLYTPHKSPSS